MTDSKHAQMLKKAEELDIDIWMFQQARELMSLNAPDFDSSNGIADPVNYDFDEVQIPDDMAKKHTWQIDLQDGKHCIEAENEDDFWSLLEMAIIVKEKELKDKNNKA